MNRRIRLLTINGRTLSISEWSCQPGAAHHSTISWRLKHFGWPPEKAVFEPSQRPLKASTIRVRIEKGNTRPKRRSVSLPPATREVAPFRPCLGGFRSVRLEDLDLVRRVA